jgi:hypothetical protein
MSYTSESGRLQILEDIAAAVTEIGAAIEQLGEAYDHLDEHLAEVLETDVFRPLQGAYGQLRRTQSDFAARYELPNRDPSASVLPPPSDPRTALEAAADAIESADGILSELQDSMLPVEVGDRELRSGLSDVRMLLDPLPGTCDHLIGTVGR